MCEVGTPKERDTASMRLEAASSTTTLRRSEWQTDAFARSCMAACTDDSRLRRTRRLACFSPKCTRTSTLRHIRMGSSASRPSRCRSRIHDVPAAQMANDRLPDARRLDIFEGGEGWLGLFHDMSDYLLNRFPVRNLQVSYGRLAVPQSA